MDKEGENSLDVMDSASFTAVAWIMQTKSAGHTRRLVLAAAAVSFVHLPGPGSKANSSYTGADSEQVDLAPRAAKVKGILGSDDGAASAFRSAPAVYTTARVTEAAALAGKAGRLAR